MKRKSLDFEPIILDNDVSPKAIQNSYNLKWSLYRIRKEQYLEMLAKQGNKCGACGADATGAEHTLCVDHDHYTNEIRGLICSPCNTALGFIEDNPETAEKLAYYLRNNGTGIYIPESR
jgi:hypothetical protein